MIISADTDKVFDKMHYPIILKSLSKLKIEGDFLNLIKSVYKSLIAKIILNG